MSGAVGPGYAIMPKSKGRQVTSRKPGSYSFVVAEKASIHNFVPEKTKGGTFDKELTTVPFRGTKTAKLKLTPGEREFHCRPHESMMQGEFTVT